jgi:hypothetical protein
MKKLLISIVLAILIIGIAQIAFSHPVGETTKNSDGDFLVNNFTDDDYAQAYDEGYNKACELDKNNQLDGHSLGSFVPANVCYQYKEAYLNGMSDYIENI